MDENMLEGKISFVHHDKHYVTIDYTKNGKKKSVNGKTGEALQQSSKQEAPIKKKHLFKEGDEVYFSLARSARGDKMIAEDIRYRYNNTIGNLINRARKHNHFTGYLKHAAGKFFIKEAGSYLFFPLLLSGWELPPDAGRLNEPVSFKLNNLDKPEKLNASLLQPHFIPQYLAAEKHFKNQTALNAAVYKITPHGIYLNLIGDKLQAKISLKNKTGEHAFSGIKEGDKIKVIVTYLSPIKIVVEPL